MGDFAVPAEVMKARLGIDVESLAVDALAGEMTAVTEAEIGREMAEDRERFEIRVERDLHERSVRSGLALRRVLDRGGYAAFSVNFQAFARGDGPVMPFLEISKAMSRGIGFGGEGDVLTAALVGALAQGFGQTTFTEIFCSDWAGDSLFLSHMGEINPDLAGARPRVVKKDYAFLGAPAAAVVCGIRAGPAAFANLVPGPDEGFDLLVAPVEMLEDTSGGNLDGTVRGWMRPALPVARFLEVYSRHGGTHHSALAMGRRAEAVAAFAGFAGLGCTRIGG
jgi:L-arabinose isomerase